MSRPATDLTAAEQANVRFAIQFLQRRWGNQKALAKALRIAPSTLRHVAYEKRVGVSAAITFRVAKLADVAVDTVLKGEWPPGETCRHCGHRKETDSVDWPDLSQR